MGLDDWSKAFQAVDFGSDVLSSAEDVKEATLFIDKADSFKTPSKRKRDPTDVGPFGDEWEFVTHERILPDDAAGFDPEVKLSVTKELLTTRTVANVETSIVTMGGALEDVAKVTLGRFVVNERDVMLMAGVIQSVKSNIGSSLGVDDVKFESPTLWGTTSLIIDRKSVV